MSFESFDVPAALHQQLKDYMSTSGSTQNYAIQFNLLYSVYSVPNIILPFFGGSIVDQFGAHYSALLFATLSFLGQLIFAIGTSMQNWTVMFLGRFIYGLGGECISVATCALNATWFEGKELALSFGINLAVSRMGSVINNLISPWVANEKGTAVAIWFGAFMNLVSVLATAGICSLTLYGKKLEESARLESLAAHDDLGTALLENQEGIDVHDEYAVEEESNLPHPSSLEHTQDEEILSMEDPLENPSGSLACISHVKNFGGMFWILSLSCIVVYGCVLPFNNVASGILLERNYFKAPPTDCHLLYTDQCSSGDFAPSSNPSFDSHGGTCSSDMNVRPILPSSLNITRPLNGYDHWDKDSYIFEALTEDNIDCGDKFWSQACTSDFCEKQNRATEVSGRVMSIPYFLSASLGPVFGGLIDRLGYRAVIASIAPILLVAVHMSLALPSYVPSPVLPLVGQGLAYACYASVLWPSVPFTVSKASTGTAFGAITAVQNIGLTIIPIIIAALYSQKGAYIPYVEYFFVGCALCGILLGFALNVMDRKSGGVLNQVHQDQNDGEDNVS